MWTQFLNYCNTNGGMLSFYGLSKRAISPSHFKNGCKSIVRVTHSLNNAINRCIDLLKTEKSKSDDPFDALS